MGTAPGSAATRAPGVDAARAVSVCGGIAPIVIEVSPPAPDAARAVALTGACSEGAKPRACELRPAESDAPADARVVWESATTAVIEVRDGSPSGRTRRISFHEEDRAEDRFRAVGLVVASLLAEPTASVVPATTAPPSPPPEPRGPRLPTAWIDAGAEMGRGLSPGPPRYGAALHGAYRLPSLPAFVGLGVAFDVAPRSDGVRATWTTCSIGAGLIALVRQPSIAIRPRVDVLFERLAADLAGAPPATGSGARWIDGAALSVLAAWPAGAPVAGVVGAGASLVSGGTAVHVDGDKIASFPAVGYGAFLGIEVALSREE
jgi:hypothetical protein